MKTSFTIEELLKIIEKLILDKGYLIESLCTDSPDKDKTFIDLLNEEYESGFNSGHYRAFLELKQALGINHD